MLLVNGVDIIEIQRIQRSIEIRREKFLKKIFTPEEIIYCESRKTSRVQSYAVRFAAKEAVSKALGTGIGQGISLKEIQVVKGAFGAPSILLTGKAKEVALAKKIQGFSLSLSHCREYAVAFVVAIQYDEGE